MALSRTLVKYHVANAHVFVYQDTDAVRLLRKLEFLRRPSIVSLPEWKQVETTAAFWALKVGLKTSEHVDSVHIFLE